MSEVPTTKQNVCEQERYLSESACAEELMGSGSGQDRISERSCSPSCTPKELGRRGERAAARFLKQRGYEILEMNWRCFAGEADIIARIGDTLCFIEVKTRSHLEKGFPAEAVDARKRSKYERIAACYLKHYEFCDIRVRFDVISILVLSEHRAFLRFHINAFGAE